jgi:hypothetical protein
MAWKRCAVMILQMRRSGLLLTKFALAGRQGHDEQLKFRSAMLLQFAEWDWEKGWVQQFHIGALRNNNSRMLQTLGKDTGWDSVGDFTQARSLAKFLDKLDKTNKLTKTILYNSNPADNELFATMAGNFNDGSMVGKIQWGSAWWFLDQKDGMIKQINALSNMGLLSRFVGMITDSRSFLSYPRHEYFRRILCDLFGDEIENGELPGDINWTGKVIRDICFYNAQNYFGWKEKFQVPGNKKSHRLILFYKVQMGYVKKNYNTGRNNAAIVNADFKRFVQADSFDVTYGGGEANVAAALCNYGLNGTFMSKVPNNAIGQSAINHLRRYGVDTQFMARGGDRLGIYFLETGAAMRASQVIYDRAGASIASADVSDFDFDKFLMVPYGFIQPASPPL